LVTGVGRSEVLPGEIYPPPNHPQMYSYRWRTGRVLPEHRLILLTDACGEFESAATGRVRFSGNTLVYLFPGVWHRYRPLEGTGWTERWVALEGEAVRQLLRRGHVTPDRAVASVAGVNSLEVEFDDLLNRVRHLSTNCTHEVVPAAFDLLTEAIALTTHVDLAAEEVLAPMAEQVEDQVVQKALEIIWNEQHTPPLGVSDVARMLPVTRRTLDRRFAEACAELFRVTATRSTACSCACRTSATKRRGRHAEALRAERAGARPGLSRTTWTSCTPSAGATRSAARSRSATTCAAGIRSP
jgi:hypothetical protein